MRGWVSLVFGVLVAALVIFVVVSNNDDVTIVLPFVRRTTSLWAALVAAAAFGAAVAAIALVWPVIRLNLQARRQSKRIAELEQEIHGLRTLPIAGETAGASSAPKV